MVFVRKELIVKRLTNFKTDSTILQKQFVLNPYYQRRSFLSKRTKYSESDRIVNKYESILLVRDLNIDLSGSKGENYDHFAEPKNRFNLTNLIKNQTCLKAQRATLLAVLLINRPNGFRKTEVYQTGLSDCQNMVLTIFRSASIILSPKIIKYRNYKGFNEERFCKE